MSNINPNPIDPIKWKNEMSDEVLNDNILRPDIYIYYLDKKIKEASYLLKNPELHKKELEGFYDEMVEEIDTLKQPNMGEVDDAIMQGKLSEESSNSITVKLMERVDKLKELLKDYIKKEE